MKANDLLSNLGLSSRDLLDSPDSESCCPDAEKIPPGSGFPGIPVDVPTDILVKEPA